MFLKMLVLVDWGCFESPRVPTLKSLKPPWNAKAWCQSRIKLLSQKLVIKKNVEGNSKKLWILGFGAVFGSPLGPVSRVPLPPLILMSSSSFYNSTFFSENSWYKQLWRKKLRIVDYSYWGCFESPRVPILGFHRTPFNSKARGQSRI